MGFKQLLWIAFALLSLLAACSQASSSYVFKRYQLKKKNRWAKTVRSALQSCEQSCRQKQPNLDELSVLECSRKCVSSDCYHELYAPDPLEPGEVDVRSNSFKGCASAEFKTKGITRAMFNSRLRDPDEL
eukprot:m.20767 g.20767  ORF g.20767 m.20767 type:complete len:130 (-) comp11051_c0_seq1:230-619(-)